MRHGSDRKALGIEMPSNHHLPCALEDDSFLAARELSHEVLGRQLEREILLPERKQGSLVVWGFCVLLVEEGPDVAVPTRAALLLGFARRSRAHKPGAQCAGELAAPVLARPAEHHVEVLLAALLATQQCLQARLGLRYVSALPFDARDALFLARNTTLCCRDPLPCVQDVSGLSCFSHGCSYFSCSRP